MRSPRSRGDGTACSRYPHKTLSFAVPSMTHGGRFPRAAAPALLQTVHSFLDVVCSSPAFLPIPGTHGWYEAMFSGSISFPAQCCWVSARLSSEELVANIPQRNRPDVLPGGAGEGEGGAGGPAIVGWAGPGHGKPARSAVWDRGCGQERAPKSPWSSAHVRVQQCNSSLGANPKYPLFPH